MATESSGVRLLPDTSVSRFSDSDSIARARTFATRRHRKIGALSGAAALVVAGILGWVAFSAATNRNFQWAEFARYFFSAEIISGVEMTLLLTGISFIVAMVLGTLVAIMRISANPILANAAFLYCWVFRGVPVLVQLILWYNFGLLFPRLSIGIWSGGTNHIITPVVAAILGLGLSQAAYLSEVVRGGLLSVDSGQGEAARSLGMSPRRTLFRIILPQAMRFILPPLGNLLIGQLKWTSLATVISVAELMNQASIIYSRNFETIPLLMVASVWYLLITTVLSVGQYGLERHYDRG